jgi:hypothetical protein
MWIVSNLEKTTVTVYLHKDNTDDWNNTCYMISYQLFVVIVFLWIHSTTEQDSMSFRYIQCGNESEWRKLLINSFICRRLLLEMVIFLNFTEVKNQWILRDSMWMERSSSNWYVIMWVGQVMSYETELTWMHSQYPSFRYYINLRILKTSNVLLISCFSDYVLIMLYSQAI